MLTASVCHHWNPVVNAWVKWGVGLAIAASFSLPSLRALGACKHQQVAHMRRRGWKQSLPPMACDPQHRRLLCKLSACGTSEWKTGAPMAGTGLTLAAVGFVGACTWRWGQSLGCFPSSHGRSRYATAVVLVPDFSGLTPMDLCWWLCDHSAWGAPGLIACIPTVEVGPRVVCTTLYFVCSHNGWQVTPQSALPDGQLRWRNTQWLLFQWECSNPAYVTLQLRNGSGGFYANN